MQTLEELKKIEFKKREFRLQSAKKQELILGKRKKEKLNITYVMTWTGVCGGTKIILEHANRLTKLGHKLTLISHDKRPDWFTIEESIDFIQVPYGEVLCEKIPRNTNVIVATYWREIYECVEQKIAPVIYFEQGDFHLFDLEKLDNRLYNYINKQMQTVNYIYTVSNFAKEKLKEVYNVEAKVIPNAVDDKVFYYEPHKENIVPNITMIGSESAEFKKIQNIIEAVKMVENKGYKLKLNWITPTEPVKNKDFIAIVNPQQKIIGDTLRNTDIYICASLYESFCLPVLEAMTCGAAIITTNNGGNADFIKENENALLIQKNNIEDIAVKLEKLLDDKKLREKLAQAGVETSKRFNWDKVIRDIEEYYKEIAEYEVKG